MDPLGQRMEEKGAVFFGEQDFSRTGVACNHILSLTGEAEKSER